MSDKDAREEARKQTDSDWQKLRAELEPDYRLVPLPDGLWDEKLEPLIKAALIYVSAHSEGYWEGFAMRHIIGDLTRIVCRIGLAAESQRTPRELADRYNENVGQILERTQAPSERGKIKSLELYYAQKDGCKKHGEGHGKICVECVSEAIDEAGTQAQAAQSSDEEPFHGSVMCDGPS